jgi:dTMP kinase
MRLIIIDGLDGVGKDTQAQLVKERYEQMGDRVIIRSHPEDDNFFGRKAKQALLGHGGLNRLKASAFYMMDVLGSIRKYYRRKDIDTLIFVRYLVGTAYLPGRLANIGYGFFENFVPTSNYMFFLDAPPDILEGRVNIREEKEMFETLDKLEKIRKKSLRLVSHWNIIDTSGSIEETFLDIEKILDRYDS